MERSRNFTHGCTALRKLKLAVGIPADRPVQRLVIVADALDALKVYVTLFAGPQHLEEVAGVLADECVEVEVVKDVEVDDRGAVTVTRL